MIRTIIQISLLRLWHNKAELVLTFLVPILFFSIFAWIFGSRGSGATPQLKIVVCDEVESDVSKAAIAILEKTQSLRFHLPPPIRPSDSKTNKIDRLAAEALVRRGIVTAAIVFAAPTQSDAKSILPSIECEAKIDIMVDSFDQVAGQVILALVQKSMMTAQMSGNPLELRPEASLYGSHENLFPSSDGQIAQAVAIHANESQKSKIENHPLKSLPSIGLVDVMGSKKTNPVIAMYAAGIAVMFLLFSATTASGSLLDERENSTLERLLCSRMTMDHLLMGKWCYLVLIGVLQTTLMFVAGAVFFGLNLFDHLDGFIAMTIVTASAAASFALMLAAMCRTRTQLGWISTIIILSMSALGGSMVPRYLMSENIQRVGQFTFNAWALDGYNKVFWRELPLIELQKELAVLVVCAFVFIVIARLFATRWDRT